MKKLLSLIGLFIMIFVLASCSLFKKQDSTVGNTWENWQKEAGTQQQVVKKVDFEGAYKSLVEKTFDNMLLSYTKGLLENKLYETKANIKAAVKHMMWEGSIEVNVTWKYGREENADPKADLTISAKWSVLIKSQQEEKKGSGAFTMLLKAIWTKTFVNLQKLDINSDDPEVKNVKSQVESFMNQRIVSNPNEAQIKEIANIKDFDFEWFMTLLSKLVKENPIIKKVGETTEWEYKVYDIKLDGDNFYKVLEGIANSKYTEGTDMTLENLQAQKDQILKDIEEAEYTAKLKVKNSSDMILEVSTSKDEETVKLTLAIKPNLTVLDLEWSNNDSNMVFNLSKAGTKTTFNGSVKDKDEHDLWKLDGTLNIEEKGKTKVVGLDVTLQAMWASIDITVDSENTEIDSLEIEEPTDAKTMEDIMWIPNSDYWPNGGMQEYNDELPQWYENGAYGQEDTGTTDY